MIDASPINPVGLAKATSALLMVWEGTRTQLGPVLPFCTSGGQHPEIRLTTEALNLRWPFPEPLLRAPQPFRTRVPLVVSTCTERGGSGTL